MTGARGGHPGQVEAAAGDLAAAVAQMVNASVAAALTSHRCCGNEPAAVAPLLLSYSQACQKLSISRATLYALLRSGDLRNISLAPKVKRIPVAELDRYIAALLAQTAEPAPPAALGEDTGT